MPAKVHQLSSTATDATKKKIGNEFLPEESGCTENCMFSMGLQRVREKCDSSLLGVSITDHLIRGNWTEGRKSKIVT